MRLCLYQPDIPQNAGTLLRLGACLGVPVDLIGPAGFDISDRGFRRAGLDYLTHADLARHDSWDELRQQIRAPQRIVLLTSKAAVNYLDFEFRADDVIMLGRESAGVPDHVHEAVDARIRIEMRPGFRSLNVAVAGAMVLGEALRQTRHAPSASLSAT